MEPSRSVLESVLVALQARRADLARIPDGRRRVEALGAIVDDATRGYDANVASNLRKFLGYFAQIGTVDVDRLIKEIAGKVHSDFDVQTRQREEEDRFDELFGTTTSIVLEQYELPESVSNRRLFGSTRYHPSPISSVRQALGALERHGVAYERFTFVDVGSGLGRNLLIAAEYPFRKIIGIEVSRYLHDIGTANLEKYSWPDRKSQSIETRCMDALEFELPDENTVLYFWEPFNTDTSNLFVDKLSKAARKTQADVVLIFLEKPFPAVVSGKSFRLLESFATLAIASRSEHFMVSLYSVVKDV